MVAAIDDLMTGGATAAAAAAEINPCSTARFLYVHNFMGIENTHGPAVYPFPEHEASRRLLLPRLSSAAIDSCLVLFDVVAEEAVPHSGLPKRLASRG